MTGRESNKRWLEYAIKCERDGEKALDRQEFEAQRKEKKS